jgi:uncharacterized protein (TIGR02271 family)
MFGNRGGESKRLDDERVVIGLFPYASGARRAVHALHAHIFTSDQIVAAFRAQAGLEAEGGRAPVPIRGNSKWFGQLREIYRADDGEVNRGGFGEIGPEATTAGFEVMLAEIDLSPQDALILDRDLDRGAAIVTVRAGARNQEARALLEQRGARIVHGLRDREPLTAIESPESREPKAATIVHSAPFNSPAEAAPDHIQLFGEVLRVRKEKVSNGDVQVRKESVTQMETVQVPVTREHLVVEHTDGSGRTDAEHAIRLPLSEERVHIDKDTVLREEYKVGKREVMQNESVTDTVRRERLLIDEASTTKTND